MSVDDPLEEIGERRDPAAEERWSAREQLALGPVDVRPVRHDEDRIPVEVGQVPIEQPLDFAGVRRSDEERQGHRPIVDLPSDGSRGPFGVRSCAATRPALRPAVLQRKTLTPVQRLGRGGLGPTASASHSAAGHACRAVVAEIRLLGAAPSIGKGQPQRCSLSFTDFLTTVVADKHCLPSQLQSSYFG